MPKEARRLNLFKRDRLVNERKFLFQELKVHQNDKIKQFEEDLANAYYTNENSINQVEEEVKDKGIDERQLIRLKYKELNVQVDTVWNSVEDGIDNTLKNICLQVGFPFKCPRCIHSGKYAGTKCFFCERNFQPYDFRMMKKHDHLPSVCIKKCHKNKPVTIHEELSEYEKIREANIESNKTKLQEFKEKCGYP